MTFDHPCAVVVTGASSGIGRACALELDRNGYHVFASVRSDKDAAGLVQAASGHLTPIRMDVTKHSYSENPTIFF